MKKIFFIISITAFSFASAQNITPYMKKDPLLPKAEIVLPGAVTLQAQFPAAKLLAVLSNGNKLYALPQDNMPCIVPDMSLYDNMPVIRPAIPRYIIPNPAHPFQIKPEMTLPEKLNEQHKENHVKIIMM